MAKSGSFDYNVTRNEIIFRALRIIGALSEGISATSAQVSNGADALNSLVKQLQTEGIRLWTYDWQTYNLSASSAVDGTDGNQYRCIRSHTSDSTNKPVTGADYSTYWIKDSGLTTSTWATATSYNSINDIAIGSSYIGIDRAFLRDPSDGSSESSHDDTELDIISFADWFSLPNKNTNGDPTAIAFDNQLTGTLYLYPEPYQADTDMVIHARVVKLHDDFDASGDTPDFPVRWAECLTFGLAHRLSYEYGIPMQERSDIAREFERLKFFARADDTRKVTSEFVIGAY